MKILIIIPAFNEEKNIESVVENLKANYSQYDYLVVNDGSRDSTAKICRANNYELLDLPINLGLAGGFQAGIKYAYENNYDAVLQFDGDGQHNPSYISTMINEMVSSGADIIIGSRYKMQKKPKGLRVLGGKVIQLAIKLTTGKNLTDPTSGMRLLNKKVLKEFAYTMNYGPEPDTIAYLMRCGVQVIEVQVEMNERIAGESYLNLNNAIKYMIRMVSSIFLVQWFRKRSN